MNFKSKYFTITNDVTMLIQCDVTVEPLPFCHSETFSLCHFLCYRMKNGKCVGEFFIRPDSVAVLITKIWAVLAFLLIYAFPTSLMMYLYGKVVYKMKKSPSTSSSTVTNKVMGSQIAGYIHL